MSLYRGLKVFLTGHTGFKGAWLAIWLRELGAKVTGYSLPPLTSPNLFSLANLAQKIDSIEGDLSNFSHLKQVLQKESPEIIFHLAAQAIVLQGYANPLDTFSSNTLGTIHLLEAVRHCPSVKAVVIVTTDKCYENCDWIWGYRENDRLGGHDPYSASKAMAELAVNSYRHSFFNTPHAPAIATARAGNVIGGGDYSAHRLLPDAMKALMAKEPISVRNPASIRPWMHVLDPLHGYLTLGARLLQHGQAYADAWNFGPLEQNGVPVKQLIETSIALWGHGSWRDCSDPLAKPEKPTLRLNWDKAAHQLAWKPIYDINNALKATVDWFKAPPGHAYDLTRQQIEQFPATL